MTQRNRHAKRVWWGRRPHHGDVPHPRAGWLEHSVPVRCVLRDRLHDVPVRDDLSVLKLEDVDDGRAAPSGYMRPVHARRDEVALGDDVLDLGAQLGERL